MKNIIVKMYHAAQKHYWSFRFITWLKELGVTRRVNGIILRKKSAADPQTVEEREKAKQYFEENKERIDKIMDMLADEKSKNVWGGVLEYRKNGTEIPKSLYSEHDQYFVKEIIGIDDGEVFIDGGAYTGDTIQQFIDTAKKNKAKWAKIIAFEPAEENYKLISKFYGNRSNVRIINKGLSDKEETLCFRESGVASAIVSDDCEAGESIVRIPVVNIDSVPECRNATWIKMDIEGAEMAALKGARNTIFKNKPKLTISIYHSDEDMIRIAEYIHELVPEYRLYIRHHSSNKVETVLYALL